MKTFFEEFKKSFSSKEWYKDLIEGKVHFKLGYAARLAFISAVIVTFFFTMILYREMIPRTKAFMLEVIPGDLVLTLKGGELSINKPVPYSLPMPVKEKTELTQQTKKNLVVIDTSKEANLSSTKTYDTLVFASKDMVVTEEEAGEIRAYSLKNIPDYMFTRDKAIDLFEYIAGKAWILSVVAAICMTVVFLMQMLLVFVFAGTLLWITLLVAKRKALWKSAFITAMYGYTIIFTANIILMVVGVPFFRFMHAVLITAIVSALFVLLNKKDEAITPQNTVS